MVKVRGIITLLILLLLLFFPSETLAQQKNYATIVNIARIAPYTKDLSTNISEQINTLNSHNVSATWLLTYDVLFDSNSIKILSERADDEIGIWLEVSSKLANDINLEYDDSLAWHYANQVFLSAYIWEERKLLINQIFKEFYDNFGYHPKTVGSWWTDARSLQYMKDKYGVVANVGVADQFSTDHYQVWGQHWSTPFLVSVNHSAVPTNETNGVVNIQWAPRDPLEGYFSSLFSFQDYKVFPVDRETEYFKKLVDFYLAQEKINQITVGLESDLSDANAYNKSSEYYKQIEYVTSLRQSGLETTTVSDFAKVYLSKLPNNQQKILRTNEFGDEVIWYQNSEYRAGIRINDVEKIIEIFDLRFYDQDLLDPYFYSPNREFNLSVYIPSIIDQFHDDYIWQIPFDEIKIEEDNNNLILKTKNKEIIFRENAIEVSEKNIIPDVVKNHPQIVIKNNLITKNENAYTGDDYIVKGLSSEMQYALKSKRNILIIAVVIIFILSIFGYLIFKRNYKLIAALIMLLIMSGIFARNFVSKSYYVSQDELSALYKLNSLKNGKVLVISQDCLQCRYNTPEKPAVFSNVRNYVSDISKKTTYKSKILNKLTREESRSYLLDNDIKYIYLVSYEDYSEEVPYQPGDLGVRLIYSNSNAQLWELVN